MKAIRLTLLCHAQTDAQKTGRWPCAEDAIVALREPPSAPAPGTQVICAPERRATETAAYLASHPHIEPALADLGLGNWHGVSLKALQAEQPDALAQWLQDPYSAPHEGESIAALCQRVGTWLSGFDTPGHWLAVTHPMVIRAALIQVLECPLVSLQRIDVLPLSRIELSYAGKWRLRVR